MSLREISEAPWATVPLCGNATHKPLSNQAKMDCFCARNDRNKVVTLKLYWYHNDTSSSFTTD